jgi:hypothetical protein
VLQMPAIDIPMAARRQGPQRQRRARPCLL